MIRQMFNGSYPKAIFFDLDGTLVDSVPDLACAIDQMLESLSYPKAGEDRVRLWVGNGARVLVQRALGFAQNCAESEVVLSDLDQAHQRFLDFYGQCSGQYSQLYPGVIETLQALQKQSIKLAVITNKPQQFTPMVLQQHGIDAFFELVLSGDSLPTKKPDPAPLQHAMAFFQLAADDCLMVGDSSSDISAANAAGVASVCVCYGYNHGNDPHLLPATAHIQHFADLVSEQACAAT